VTKEGRKEGRKGGREDGRKVGWEGGRKEKRKEGRKCGGKEESEGGRREVREEERREGRKEGGKGGRKEGGKEGRKEGRKASRFGYMLCRNGLLKRDIEGKVQVRMEMSRRRGRRSKRPLDDLREKTWHWKLKEEALDRTLWRTRFGRGYGPVVRRLWTCREEAMDLS
jgi:hypothetical protein